MEWKKVKLGDITIGGKGFYGIGAPAVDFNPLKYTYLRITDINDDGTINYAGLKSVDDPEAYKYILKPNDIVFARTGATTGRTYFYLPQDGTFVYAGFLIKFSIDPKKANPRLLKYITHSQEYYDWVRSFDTGGTRGNINAKTFADMPLCLPDRATQDKIVAILSSLDDKIENNNRINRNLEAQAQALFKSWFVDFEPWGGKMPEDWEKGHAEEFCTINIGKTPPRKEKEWFTHDNRNCKWVSISDMATCGTFISDSSEYLTQKAVDKFNIVMVPKDSILLSFKLTIGRVAIAQTELTTNEAIARFILPKPIYREYLYLLLKKYNYSQLGSTSSIATAVNSKIIKSMSIYMPNDDILREFSSLIKPFFDQIANNQRENVRLAALRDTLLPKLMKGEIEV